MQRLKFPLTASPACAKSFVGGIVHPDDLGDLSMRPGLSDGLCAHGGDVLSVHWLGVFYPWGVGLRGTELTSPDPFSRQSKVGPCRLVPT